MSILEKAHKTQNTITYHFAEYDDAKQAMVLLETMHGKAYVHLTYTLEQSYAVTVTQWTKTTTP